MHSSEHLGMTHYCCLHYVLADFGEVSEGHTVCIHCLLLIHSTIWKECSTGMKGKFVL